METVWVLVIEHEYGFNHYVNRSKDGMLDTLADYCREWWGDLEVDDEIPSDRGELIEMYFDLVYEEWYTCDEVSVHP